MRWVDNLTVQNRLLASFAISVLLTVAVGAAGILSLAKMQRTVITISGDDLDGLYWLEEANKQQLAISLAASNYSEADSSGKERLRTTAIYSIRAMHSALENVAPTNKSASSNAIFAEILSSSAGWESLVEIYLGVRTMPEDVDRKELIRRAMVASGQARDALSRLIVYKRESAASDQQLVLSDYRAMRLLMLALMGTSVIVGGTLAAMIARRIAAQLGGEPAYAVEVASRVASGQLSLAVRTRAGDSTSLICSLADMREKLSHIVWGIRESSESISLASQEIAQGNIDLSQRTAQQAAALQETAASIEELTSTVRQTADNAEQATRLAEGAIAVTEKGVALVAGVVETMRMLSAKSMQLTEIISTIEGVAFQTNVLALNAAVEAARSGEQGRGFAVVAAEVRSLAQRSAVSAREIKELIDDSTYRVSDGTEHAENAGATMSEVAIAVQRVTSIMTEIAAASKEQSVGIEQINRAVSQMDETTQQNAALVEQAAAAASAMALQADTLRDAVSVFQVADITLVRADAI